MMNINENNNSYFKLFVERMTLCMTATCTCNLFHDLCSKEALRMFPSVPFFGRSLTEDTKIGTLFLFKVTIFIN